MSRVGGEGKLINVRNIYVIFFFKEPLTTQACVFVIKVDNVKALDSRVAVLQKGAAAACTLESVNLSMFIHCVVC